MKHLFLLALLILPIISGCTEFATGFNIAYSYPEKYNIDGITIHYAEIVSIDVVHNLANYFAREDISNAESFIKKSSNNIYEVTVISIFDKASEMPTSYDVAFQLLVSELQSQVFRFERIDGIQSSVILKIANSNFETLKIYVV